jgi:acetylornithine/succinyldiaminopimelate/putrescine aminotransferase
MAQNGGGAGCGGRFRVTASTTGGLFDVFEERPSQVYGRYGDYVNHRFERVIELIGFDKVFTRAEGAWIWDQDGNKYLDFLGGYSVFNVGRNHPRVKQALIDWLQRDGASMVQMECSPLAGMLGEKLAQLTPGELNTTFFTNSGSETAEVGLKMARKATGKPRILYTDLGFHGLTYGAISVSDDEMWRKGFEPFVPGATKIPWDDLGALERELAKGDVAALITEPIQGEGGVRIPSDDYLPEALRMLHRAGALLIVDEIQTGFGRTGRWWASNHWDLEPDIMLLSKGLSGGYVPVGAVVTHRRIFDKVFEDLAHAVVHTTTFGMNAMAMTAGLATIEVMESEGVVEHCASVGAELTSRLQALASRFEMVKEVRGKGLMIGIEFGEPKSLTLKAGWKLLHRANAGLFGQMLAIPLMRDHGILTQVAGHNMDVHKLAPPLVIGPDEIDYFVNAYEQTLVDLHKFPGPLWDLGTTLLKNRMSW